MNKFIYSLLLSLFIIFVLALNSVFYINNSNVKGNINVNKKYSMIKYENVENSDNNLIFNLKSNFNNIYFDIVNIGNKNLEILNYKIYNLDTNLDKSKLNIELSLKNGIIMARESKRVYLDIECLECEINENSYINFIVNYNYE